MNTVLLVGSSEKSQNHAHAKVRLNAINQYEPAKRNMATGNSSHGRYRNLFAVVGVSLKQRPKLYCF